MYYPVFGNQQSLSFVRVGCCMRGFMLLEFSASRCMKKSVLLCTSPWLGKKTPVMSSVKKA